MTVPPTRLSSFNAHIVRAPTTKILNHVTKSTQDSDYVGKVGVEQKGTDTSQMQEVSETHVPRMQLPRWGDSWSSGTPVSARADLSLAL